MKRPLVAAALTVLAAPVFAAASDPSSFPSHVPGSDAPPADPYTVAVWARQDLSQTPLRPTHGGSGSISRKTTGTTANSFRAIGNTIAMVGMDPGTMAMPIIAGIIMNEETMGATVAAIAKPMA
jgi:hypothetical protein